RQRRDADVDEAAVDAQSDSPVLRYPALGDVEVGHDLDPRDQPGGEALRDRRRVDDDAVDPETDAEVAAARIEVDVGGAAVDCICDQRMAELDDRGLVGG